MRLEEMEKYYMQWGIFIFKQNDKQDRRKTFYKIKYPVFADGKEIPVSNNEYIVKKPSDVQKYIDSLLRNQKYKEQCEQWLKNN